MPADIATLLAEAPWLARLARSLTGDITEADDLVQETYAAALRSPPETDRPIRPWLRRVATNLTRMRHRGSSRRAANELIVEAQTDPVPTPEELVERAQLERRLAELVLELDEPFRSTVLLRYREGFSAEQIAKQQHIPAGTVRNRLKRALDRLRSDLDEREHNQMRALFAAPLASAAHKAATPAPTMWRIVMAKLTSKVAIVVALALLLFGGAMLVWKRSSLTQRDNRGSHASSAPNYAARELITRPAMFVQAGVAARRVRGRVTSDGMPYRGALVQLTHGETQVVVAEVRSATDGTFDLGDRPADSYVVTATAPGRTALPLRIDLRMPTTAPIELRLIGCTHLRGTVVDGSGAPINHARVARDDAPTIFAETDASGRYDLCKNYGNARIRYSAAGYHSMLIELQAVIGWRDVVLVPEAIVEGTVVSDDDKPVGGAWVVIDPSDKGVERNARAAGFSAPDGTFRITGVSPGRNLIAGFAPGLRSTHKQEIVAGAGQVVSGIVIRLGRNATITGTVVEGGAPVVGVGVGMKVGNRDETGVLAVTQTDGSFVIDRAPRGDVAVYVVGHSVIAPRSVHIADQPVRVQIQVQRLGRVRGRVLRGSEPVADAQVGCPWSGMVFTDSGGNYVCDGLNDGPQDLYADAAGGEWGHATVTVKRGETAYLDIPLTFEAAICGRVVDNNATPLAGINVFVAERTTHDFGTDTSSTDGTFCARLLTGGTYTIEVFAGARAIAPLTPIGDVTLGPRETKQVTIAVTAPTLTISGTVSDPRGAPVADAIVRVVAAERLGTPVLSASVPSSLTITDEDGRFALNKLAPGDYTLVVTARRQRNHEVARRSGITRCRDHARRRGAHRWPARRLREPADDHRGDHERRPRAIRRRGRRSALSRERPIARHVRADGRHRRERGRHQAGCSTRWRDDACDANQPRYDDDYRRRA